MATVDIEPSSLALTPGKAEVFTLTVRNDGDEVEAYHLTAVDEAAKYVVIEPETLLVHPGDTATAAATITLEHTGRWAVGDLIVRFHIVPAVQPGGLPGRGGHRHRRVVQRRGRAPVADRRCRDVAATTPRSRSPTRATCTPTRTSRCRPVKSPSRSTRPTLRSRPGAPRASGSPFAPTGSCGAEIPCRIRSTSRSPPRAASRSPSRGPSRSCRSCRAGGSRP